VSGDTGGIELVYRAFTSRRLFVCVTLVVLLLSTGCSPQETPAGSEPEASNPSSPTSPPPAEWGYTVRQTSERPPDDTGLGAVVREHEGESAELLLWFPHGAKVGTVDLDGTRLVITLVPEETRTVGPSRVRRLQLNGDLPAELVPVFVDAAGGEFVVNIAGEEAVDLVGEEVLSEPSVTAWSLHGREADDGLLRLSWLCYFGDGEALNAAHDAIISGQVMVDARTGELYEPELTLNIPYPGLTVVPDVGDFLGVTADNTLLTREGKSGTVYVISPDGQATVLDEVPPYDHVDDWHSTMMQGTGHEVCFETREAGEFGPVLESITILEVATGTELDATPPMDADDNVELTVSAWQWYPYNGAEESLFYVTETPGPSYGDWWTHYQLWEYRLESQELIQHCTLPTSHFYVMPPGDRVAFDRGSGVMVKKLGQ